MGTARSGRGASNRSRISADAMGTRTNKQNGKGGWKRAREYSDAPEPTYPPTGPPLLCVRRRPGRD
uniref:Uncharacterized protein n=2 Tax=Human herpesvirus 2 TaxID=10310 RepID=A0A481T4F7_HHV2|nr:hypothetical protein [Human alphaherpesvirus 2]